ncbi:MAG: ABC transporter permease [Deltaproteobacteria bacterium]|nr:ABC transporter permease [Deltaproteobacteria bacterium]
MILLETLRLALRALLRNGTRSFLTMLGVIIGVAAVIAMVAIGEGARQRVAETFASMGSNLLVVMHGTSQVSGSRGGSGTQPTLTWEDLAAIRTELPSVKLASVQARAGATVASDTQNWTTSVFGVDPGYFEIRAWSMRYGRVFTPSEADSGAKVVVLGQTVVDKLFEGSDVVGSTVRIRNMPFEVVGVLARKGQSPTGQDYDDTAMIPINTYNSRMAGGLRRYIPGVIFVSATSEEATARAERDIRNLLRDRHRLGPGVEDDFHLRNMAEVAQAQQEGTETMTALLAAVALVALLVGGIGIMNIMLVSVTERTREIGIRMAVGARPGHILWQFLVEALTLSSLGGALGVGLGIYVANRLSAQFGWPLMLRGDVMAVALGFSGLVGVVFGMYPARKASRMDPIEALRWE